MRVLITGASGFLGSDLTRRFLADGRNVRVLVRSPQQARVSTDAGAKVVTGDITDRAAVREAITGVEVVYQGDAAGNGLLRRVIYKMPLGRKGSALELVRRLTPEEGYTYTMLSREPGQDQTGKVTLARVGPNRTRLDFEERYHLTKAPWRWFEGPIYRFINKQNEASMRALSQWLTDHPEYRPDLVDAPA